MAMELRQIKYLITVIDEGTFTAAASRLRVAQSVVSHHIGKLERELGVQLLRRESPKVIPTPQGEIFAARARRILAEVSAATEDLSDLRGQTGGTVAFGATIPAASFDVAGLIGTFRADYPGVRVRLREGTRSELLDMICDDSIDVAVVSAKPDDVPEGIIRVLVDIDHLVLAGPLGHPFEHHDVIRVQELDGVDLVTFREGAGLRRAADEVLEQAGVRPNVVIESNQMHVLVGLVSQGLGLAILPRAFVAQSTKPLWSRPLDPPINPPLTLVWREGRRRSPPADVFLRHVIQFASAQRRLQPEM